jgi:hypothetical protein
MLLPTQSAPRIPVHVAGDRGARLAPRGPIVRLCREVVSLGSRRRPCADREFAVGEARRIQTGGVGRCPPGN